MKTLIAAIVATMAFATSMAFADTVTNHLPWVPLNISGTIVYQAGSTTNGTTAKGALKTVSFNAKSLIALLNASTNVQTTLLDVTGTNQIPDGSYFVYDIFSEYLIVTNKNGFGFNLDDYSTYDYGDLIIGYNDDVSGYGTLIGSSSINTNTFAGTEQDQSAISFTFNDGNGNQIASYGNGSLDWHYGAVSGGAQKTSVTLSAQPAGWYAYVNGSPGITKGVKINGTGSSLTFPIDGQPFYIRWEE